jgi:hypothetical protein
LKSNVANIIILQIQSQIHNYKTYQLQRGHKFIAEECITLLMRGKLFIAKQGCESIYGPKMEEI